MLKRKSVKLVVHGLSEVPEAILMPLVPLQDCFPVLGVSRKFHVSCLFPGTKPSPRATAGCDPLRHFWLSALIVAHVVRMEAGMAPFLLALEKYSGLVRKHRRDRIGFNGSLQHS